MEAEDAGWAHHDDGTRVAIMDDCETGGVFSPRDYAMRRW